MYHLYEHEITCSSCKKIFKYRDAKVTATITPGFINRVKQYKSVICPHCNELNIIPIYENFEEEL